MNIAAYRKRLRRSLEGCRPKLSLRLCLFEEGFDLDLFGFFIPLPFLDRYTYLPHEIMESWGAYYFKRTIWWGAYYFEQTIWFCWGRHSKSFYMPWMLEHIKCEVLRPDGSWVPYVGCWEDKEPDGRWKATYPYLYTLQNGETQKRNATIYVERREWRQRWLKWCPLFAKRHQSINVEFDGEVGERTGSWKGGTIGCGYLMRPNETPKDTLHRMEREQKFS